MNSKYHPTAIGRSERGNIFVELATSHGKEPAAKISVNTFFVYIPLRIVPTLKAALDKLLLNYEVSKK